MLCQVCDNLTETYANVITQVSFYKDLNNEQDWYLDNGPFWALHILTWFILLELLKVIYFNNIYNKRWTTKQI